MWLFFGIILMDKIYFIFLGFYVYQGYCGDDWWDLDLDLDLDLFFWNSQVKFQMMIKFNLGNLLYF